MSIAEANFRAFHAEAAEARDENETAADYSRRLSRRSQSIEVTRARLKSAFPTFKGGIRCLRRGQDPWLHPPKFRPTRSLVSATTMAADISSTHASTVICAPTCYELTFPDHARNSLAPVAPAGRTPHDHLRPRRAARAERRAFHGHVVPRRLLGL